MSFTVKAHTSIVGDTGYNCHSRNFFKELDKLVNVQVRNFTVGSTWNGYKDEPHNDEYYMDDQLKKMLVEQTLHTPNGREEFPLYNSYGNKSTPDVHIVLNETDHYYFYDHYDGFKIAYNVWETTRQPENFFEKLKTFDQVWVPTEWQKKCTVEQGIPEEKVKVVPEGVDTEMYTPLNRVVSNPINRPFRFIMVGRWDYRKSTLEIIETFVKTFSEEDNVELVISVDNPFANDGMNSTEERLKKFGIKHSGIKVVHHLSKQDYVSMLRTSDVFLSCARSEGWNLPLIEAMSCGIPSIYSNWGGQLEFAKDKGIPVNILKEVPAASGLNGYYTYTQNAPGNFAEPDFTDLSFKMRDIFENYVIYKKRALDESDKIREVFTWENAAKIAKNILDEIIRKESISVVIGRPDNDRRKDLLKQCISTLKTEVILSTNYPVDSEIQSMVDYYVYSKENPLLLKSEYEEHGVNYVYWNLDENGEKQYNLFEYEHGYAAYLLTRRGLEFAKKLGKKIVHVINYDYEICEETISSNEDLLNTSDLIFTENEWQFETPLYCSAFISGKIDPLLEYFTKYNSKKSYYTSVSGFNILELNMTTHYNDTNYTMIKIPRKELEKKNKLNQESLDNMKFDSPNKTISNIENKIVINFIDSPFVEILGDRKEEYEVTFIDTDKNQIVFSSKIKNNHWTRPNRKWFTNWKIQIKNSFGKVLEYNFDLKDQRVLISFESSSLGDTLAWIPYVEEFREKHNCYVIVSTFQNDLFKSMYPELEFIAPGTSVNNLYAAYRLGVFYDENGIDVGRHKTDFRKLPLQSIASDILGLEYKEIRPLLDIHEKHISDKPYICIANHSTNQSNYWNNPTGWQELVDYVKSLGYDVYLLSREEDGYMGNFNPKGVIKIDGKSLKEIGSILLGAKCFVGVGSGLAWLSWGLGLPTCIISGRTYEFVEPTSNVYRIINTDVCHGCFNRHLFDKSDWNWCPEHKGTQKQFECSKEISFDMVKSKLNDMLKI